MLIAWLLMGMLIGGICWIFYPRGENLEDTEIAALSIGAALIWPVLIVFWVWLKLTGRDGCGT